MQLITFIFSNNLNSKTCEVKGSTMKRAMHGAAMKMGVPECNLVFLRIVEVKAA